MTPEEQSAGATPAAEGATPSQSTPAQPATGTPAAPVQPASSTTPQTQSAATAGDDQLGDAGKRALAAERQRAETAEREGKALKTRIEELENASKSDADKAIAAARKEGEQASTGKWSTLIRSARVESALTVAGALDPSVAAQARDFASLAVADDGSVSDLDKAIETFKAAHPALFGTPKAPDFGGGSRSGGTGNKPATTLEEAVAAALQ